MSSSKAPRQPFASLYFFPLAAAYACFLLPWSVLAQLEVVDALPGIEGGIGHAHEMLFGFAFAVVAGYVLGPQPRRLIFTLIGLWSAARIGFLGWPGTWVSALLNIGFVTVLGYRVVPRFAKTAKKWRNKAVAPIITALCLVVALFQWLYLNQAFGALHGILFEAVLLLSTLMFFMGGRMIAPAVAGHLLKKDRDLEARVQPGLEGAVLILMGLALALNLVPMAEMRPLVGLLLMISAGLALIRTLRWRAWHCLDRPDLLALILGYLWLITGWLLISLALTVELLPISVALHALTIGALGTLTLTVMARTRMQRSQGDPRAMIVIYLAVALLSVATLARLAATGMPLLIVAAFSWGLAYFGLLAVLLYLANLDSFVASNPLGREVR